MNTKTIRVRKLNLKIFCNKSFGKNIYIFAQNFVISKELSFPKESFWENMKSFFVNFFFFFRRQKMFSVRDTSAKGHAETNLKPHV
jgi:hypothetical protein